MKNGVPEGLGTVWYESGEKMIEIHMKNGVPEGLATSWYESGKIELKRHYKNGNYQHYHPHIPEPDLSRRGFT